jgi:glutathione S-transferase
MAQPLHLIIGNKNYSSWSLRPWLAMKFFKIPFHETVIPLDMSDTNRNILTHSPAGRVPVLNGEGFKVWDSLAICETLNDLFPEKKMWPSNLGQRARARAISNEMHSGFQTLRNLCPMKVKESFESFDYSQAQEDIDRIEEIWSDELRASKGPFLFGTHPTIADAMYAPVVFRINTYKIKTNDISQKYVKHMLNLPAMIEWTTQAKEENFVMSRYENK